MAQATDRIILWNLSPGALRRLRVPDGRGGLDTVTFRRFQGRAPRDVHQFSGPWTIRRPVRDNFGHTFKSVNIRLLRWLKNIKSVREEPPGLLYFLAPKAKTRSPLL